MDLQFSTKLQTAMQNLGRTNGLAAPKSQDSADTLLHEAYVAITGASLFDKRKKIAIEVIKKLDVKGVAKKGVADAEKKGVTGTYVLVDTENYTANVTVKSPVKAIDPTLLTNELIKLGVDAGIVTKALFAATVTRKPAESYTIVVKTT